MPWVCQAGDEVQFTLTLNALWSSWVRAAFSAPGLLASSLASCSLSLALPPLRVMYYVTGHASTVPWYGVVSNPVSGIQQLFWAFMEPYPFIHLHRTSKAGHVT